MTPNPCFLGQITGIAFSHDCTKRSNLPRTRCWQGWHDLYIASITSQTHSSKTTNDYVHTSVKHRKNNASWGTSCIVLGGMFIWIRNKRSSINMAHDMLVESMHKLSLIDQIPSSLVMPMQETAPSSCLA